MVLQEVIQQAETVEPSIEYPPHGKIIATNVSEADFMAGYEGMRVEWVKGMVIEMPSVDYRNNLLSQYLIVLLNIYLQATQGGELFHDPMIMALPDRNSAPDIQVLLPHSLGKLQTNRVVGAADVVIEIVSEGSQSIDRVDKYKEYEKGGVPEYWLFDPIYQEALFFQRNAEGMYERIAPDAEGVYHSQILPQFAIKVATLWQEKLPTVRETIALVDAMLGQ